MARHPWLIGLAVLAACKGKPGEDTAQVPTTETTPPPTETEETEPAPTSNLSLVVVVPPEAVAGVPVLVDVQVHDDDYDVDVTDSATVTVTVAPTEGATVDGTELKFTKTGTYAVTVDATFESASATFTGELIVIPADPYNIDLALAPGSIEAGGATIATWEVIDRYSNVIEDAAVTLTIDPPDGTSVKGNTVSATVAGAYQVSADVSGFDVDNEPLIVTAGATTTLDLVLPSPSAEVGEVVTAVVVTTDAYGNPTVVPWTLDASPAATIAEPTVQFDADGVYTVTAAWDTLADEEIVTVDSNGPLITVTSPTRGVYSGTGRMTVAGTVADSVSGVTSLEINGTPVVPDAAGAFSISSYTANGSNTAEIVATDGDGNTSDAVVGYMSGEYHPDGETMDDVIEARLTPDALDGIASLAEGGFDPSVIESELLRSNPLYSYNATCWPDPIDIELSATGFEWSSLDVELNPDTGLLEVVVYVKNLDVDFTGSASACFFDAGSFTGSIVDTVTVATLQLDLDVAADGSMIATVVDSDLVFTAFDVQFSGSVATIESILSLVGVNIDALAETEVRNALLPELEAAVPAALEDTLGSINIETSFDLGGGPIDLSAVLAEIFIDPDGLTLALEGTIGDGLARPGMPVVPGSVLFSGSPRPTWPAAPEMQLGLSMEMINALLHEAWQAGMFEMSLSSADLGLDPALIGLLFPGATTLDIDVAAKMAPVILEGAGSAPLDLQLFELQLDMWGLVAGVDSHLATVSVQTVAELELATSVDGVELAPGAIFAVADTHTTSADAVSSDEVVESVLEALVVDLFPTLFAPIAIEVPTLAGFSLTLTSTWTDGPWIVAGGDLR